MVYLFEDQTIRVKRFSWHNEVILKSFSIATMSHSLIVSNIPIHLNNATLDRYLTLKGVQVNILAFPDEYHHINDDAKTKTLQLIAETPETKVKAADIFQDTDCLHEIDELAAEDEKNSGEHGYALGSSGQVHDATHSNQFIVDDVAKQPASNPQSARRISVTMI